MGSHGPHGFYLEEQRGGKKLQHHLSGAQSRRLCPVREKDRQEGDGVHRAHGLLRRLLDPAGPRRLAGEAGQAIGQAAPGGGPGDQRGAALSKARVQGLQVDVGDGRVRQKLRPGLHAGLRPYRRDRHGRGPPVAAEPDGSSPRHGLHRSSVAHTGQQLAALGRDLSHYGKREPAA